MKVKRIHVNIDNNIKEGLPLFYNFIESINITKSSSEGFQLVYSTLYDSYSIIEPSSKKISNIIDYSLINK